VVGDVGVVLIFGFAGLRVWFGVGVVAGVAFEPHFDENTEKFFGFFREGEGFDWVKYTTTGGFGLKLRGGRAGEVGVEVGVEEF